MIEEVSQSRLEVSAATMKSIGYASSGSSAFWRFKRRGLGFAVVLAVFLFLAALPTRLNASEKDMRVDQIKGEYTDQIDELYASGSTLYIAILRRAHTRLHQWEIDSQRNADLLAELEQIGSIEALHGDGSTLWLGTAQGKIYQWQRGESRPTEVTAIAGKVEALCWNGSILWIGTGQGLFRWDRGSPATRAFSDTKKVKSIFEDDTALWIGTESGLYTWNKDPGSQPRLFPLDDNLDRATIRAIQRVNEKLWVGSDSGLYRRQGNVVERVLPEISEIKSLALEGSRLWIGTRKGLFRIDGVNSKWEAGIRIITRPASSINAESPVLVKWEIQNYAGRTSPEIVEQKVVVSGGGVPDVPKEIPRGIFEAAFPAIDKPGSYALEIQAKDLSGEVARNRLTFTVASPSGDRTWLINAGKVWIGHALFWVLLIFAYPKYPQVQAIFFWNPWARRIIGLGYVGFALTWIPYLRAKLLAPFKESLLADAALTSFSPNAYFDKSGVKNSTTGEIRPLKEAISEIKGQVVLEGESGLGKSMFLRHLVHRSKRIVVYLPAERCAAGVIEAIQNKLHGLAGDATFLRSLIYSGALDICIDGLNEVTPDTRAKVSAFAESYFKGNIIMATQPMEWRPPATSRTYLIQPLTPPQIEEFLFLLQQSLPEDAAVTGEAYRQTCRGYLVDALDENQPSDLLASARRILSNPMDLSVVADILSRRERPDLFRLVEQQYRIMAEDYERVHGEFPLSEFSERVYAMKLEDKPSLPAQDCIEEIQCMWRHKMVVRHLSSNEQQNPTDDWRFRHDKIMEFFVVQTFLGVNNERPVLHLGDPRFRGVYFLLAMLMPLKDAEALREHLIDYAVDTKDHTVSDTFIQLLRSRKAA